MFADQRKGGVHREGNVWGRVGMVKEERTPAEEDDGGLVGGEREEADPEQRGLLGLGPGDQQDLLLPRPRAEARPEELGQGDTEVIGNGKMEGTLPDSCTM